MPHVGVPPELIRTELDKILGSRVFARADRPSRFLRFVVEYALEDGRSALKEYPIGVSVLGRGESFDPRLDPIVRVEAGRLRSRLHEYYKTEGPDDPVVIDLPKGSYVPIFHERRIPPDNNHELSTPVTQDEQTIPAHTAADFYNPAPVARERLFIVAVVGIAGLIGVIAAVWTWFLAASAPIKSLAVLPLVNLSGDANQEYFADGMTEALITELGAIEALRVISRTSVMRYKGSQRPLSEIARQLKAEAVVEGSVLRAGDRIRITMKLIHAGSERQLWTETYDRSISDVLAVQGEVARAVRAKVRGKLAGDEHGPRAQRRAVAPEAMDAYLRARYWANKRTPEGINKAVDHYQQAIAADASYALAHSGLAEAYVLSIAGNLVPSEVYFPKVRAAARRALELDSTLAEPHVLLAAVQAAYEWNWPGAEREYLRALALEPGFAAAHQRYALSLMWAGRFEDAFAAIKHARELDPLSPILDGNECEILYNARQFQRSIDYCLKAIERNPEVFHIHRQLGKAYAATGKFREAIAELQKALSLGGGVSVIGTLGRVYAISGNRTEATKILHGLEQSKRTENFYDIALIHAAFGGKDRAFQWLERCYRAGSRSLIFLRVAPELDSLRGDPRFSDLVRRRFKSVAR